MTGLPGMPPSTAVPAVGATTPRAAAPPPGNAPAQATPIRRPARMSLGQAPGASLAKPAPRDETPRPARLGPVKLAGGGDSVAATSYVPHAVSGNTWGEVPDRLRAEVLERAAVLNIRGTLPDEAVRKALGQSLEDEEEAEAPFDWTVARAMATAFPVPFRDVDHRPSAMVLRMAALVERLCEAELSQPGAGADHREYFAAFGLSAKALDAISAAYRSRLDAMRRMAPAETADEEPLQRPRQAMFGMENEYDGLMRP